MIIESSKPHLSVSQGEDIKDFAAMFIFDENSLSSKLQDENVSG